MSQIPQVSEATPPMSRQKKNNQNGPTVRGPPSITTTKPGAVVMLGEHGDVLFAVITEQSPLLSGTVPNSRW